VRGSALGECFAVAWGRWEEDRHLVATLSTQGAQPALVVEAGGAVEFHHPLVEAQAWRAAIPLAHPVFVEVGIAGQQTPAIVTAQCDARMAVGMAGQGHEQQVGPQSGSWDIRARAGHGSGRPSADHPGMT
jgi:hypothetical protein